MVQAWQAICEHPFFGLGVENTTADLEKLSVHNTILRLWAGIGFGGLVFICWIYFLALRAAIKNLKEVNVPKIRQYAPISFLVLIDLIGWFLVDMVQPQFYDRFKFVTLILLFSLSGVIVTSKGTTMTPKKKSS
jgi:O-antigen ligase